MRRRRAGDDAMMNPVAPSYISPLGEMPTRAVSVVLPASTEGLSIPLSDYDNGVKYGDYLLPIFPSLSTFPGSGTYIGWMVEYELQ